MRPLSIFIAHPSPLLTDCNPHGDGLVAFSLLRELALAGHTLHVAAALVDIQSTLPANVIIYPIKTRAAQYPDERQSLSFRIEYAIQVRRLFDRISRETHIDLIHQLNPVVLGLSALLYRRGVPLLLGPFPPLWKVEGNWKSRVKSWLRDKVVRVVLSRSDGMLTPNHASRAMLERVGISPSRLFHLSYGMDTHAFFPDASQVPEVPTILYMAGLWKRKGIYTLLSAFELVAQRLPEARLLIAGTGEEQEEIERRIAQMQSRGQISLLGHIPRNSIREAMQRCSLYCLPSFGEPFGMSALEAMACGRPLVVTNSGGLAELVPEQGGLKVPEGDAPALADALCTVLMKPAMAEAMGAYNRQYVLDKFEWSIISTQLASIYDTMLTNGTARTRASASLSVNPVRNLDSTVAGPDKPLHQSPSSYLTVPVC
jgi:glycosyltransferase involved in cell wall biosynthesis